MPRLGKTQEAVTISHMRDKILESKETLARFLYAFFQDPRGLTDEEGKPKGLRLAPYQLEFIWRVLRRDPGKFVFIASRRAGKSFSTAVAGLLMALLYDNEDVIIIAPTGEQAGVIYSYIRSLVTANDHIYALVDKTQPFRLDRMYFTNGSVIRAKSVAKNDRVLGFGASTLIIDETASIDDRKLRTEVLGMLAAPRNMQRPVLVLLGTPHRSGLLYEAWNSPEFYKMRVTWRDAVEAGIIDADFIQTVRRMLSEDEFKAWYEAEFVDPASMLFPVEKVKELMRLKHMHNKPRADKSYVAGLDVALGGEDCTALAIVAYDPKKPIWSQSVEVAYLKELCGARAPRIASWVGEKLAMLNVPVIGVDAIGVGDTMVDYLREKLEGRAVYPIKLQGQDRIDAYNLLRRAILEERIIFPQVPRLDEQFASFKLEHKKDGSPKIVKSEGVRDDMVDAITIAYYMAYRKGGMNVDVSFALDEFVRSVVGR